MLYNAGSVAGIGVSFLTGMKAATWATTAMGPLKWVGVGLGAVDTAFDGYGAAIATNNLNQSWQNNGKFEIQDTWNLLAYVPFGLAAIKGIKGLLGASNLPKNGIQGVNDVLGDTQKTITKAGNCFVAGTEILTVDGIKNIEDIVVGDWVIADDPTTPGGIEAKQVLDTFVRETDALVDLYVDGEVISTTGEHPFWVTDKGWVEAKDLVVGSLLQTGDGRVVDVDKIEKREGKFPVYNFKVEGIPTYFVSELGVLVHNANYTPPPPWRGKPIMLDGNSKKGWQHIDERHITGTSAKGPGDLFPPGTTRAELEKVAEKIVKKGTRSSGNPQTTMQNFEDRVKIQGQHLRVRVSVDTTTGEVISMFPVQSE